MWTGVIFVGKVSCRMAGEKKEKNLVAGKNCSNIVPSKSCACCRYVNGCLARRKTGCIFTTSRKGDSQIGKWALLLH